MKRILPTLAIILLAGASLVFALGDKPTEKEITPAATAPVASTAQTGTPATARCDKAPRKSCQKSSSHRCCNKGTDPAGVSKECCKKSRHHARKGCAGEAAPEAKRECCKKTRPKCATKGANTGCQRKCPNAPEKPSASASTSSAKTQ